MLIGKTSALRWTSFSRNVPHNVDLLQSYPSLVSMILQTSTRLEGVAGHDANSHSSCAACGQTFQLLQRGIMFLQTAHVNEGERR